jgi:hypothetical protein
MHGSVNLEMSEGLQVARAVNTMGGKMIYCQFYPIDKAYHTCFPNLGRLFTRGKIFGPVDAPFPKLRVALGRQGVLEYGDGKRRLCQWSQVEPVNSPCL